ncbi:hypothetical protein BOX15_Mlig012130g1 [Macrostomum lignano]|uniref:Uncharacterized protein n=1 Tax=Macrostomum lignano TaxID=282301 RepID=A0A267DMT8_9PLAT|nr:hypothetical protein BOX15_Mlig012130g1 [Macrostomum lignano]
MQSSRPTDRCFLAILLLFLFTMSACSDGKIAVRQAQIAQSWQSSVYTGNEDYCFMMRPRSLGDWNYFHSGEEPDASGYQWLLIKLTKPARLVAVTVFARPGELKRRAVGTEVLLLGEQVPNGLLQPEANSRCLASLAGLSADGATNGIFQCGRVRADDAESAKLDFACHQTDCARLTRFILLRRLVRDQADKIFNFVGLEIEESQSSEFLTCEMRSGKVGDCTRNGLYQQRAGRASQLVKACLPCQLTVQDEVPSCQLMQPGSQDVQDLRVLPVSRPQSEFLFMLSECPQCGLRCSYRCSGQPGALRSISDTILFHEPPKAVKLLFRDTNPEAEQLPRSQYWPADQLRTIVFFTESAFPKPEHSCLLTGPCLASGTELIPTKSEILSSAPSSNGIPTFSLLSKYRLFANKSISRCSIRCYSRSQGSPGTQQPEMKEAQLPQLVYECNTVFHVPTRERWIEGAVLDLKVDSSKNNPVPTLHTCSLRTVYGFIALNPISTTLKTSTYRLNATRSWGTHVAIVCQVNQSGVHVQSNVQHPLPDVLYKAETEISSCMVDQASIRVTVVTTGGIPPPNSVLCGVGKDAQSVRSSRTNASSLEISSLNSLTWSFDPMPLPAKALDRKILCTVYQADQTRFESEHSALFETGTASACEGGVDLWKIGLTVIAVAVAGPFLLACLRSVLRCSYRKLTQYRRGSWSPSEVPMATYSRGKDCANVDLDGLSADELWGVNSGSGAASTCNTLLNGCDVGRRAEPFGNRQEAAATVPDVVYAQVLKVSGDAWQQEEVNKSAASLATEYTEIVKSNA